MTARALSIASDDGTASVGRPLAGPRSQRYVDWLLLSVAWIAIVVLVDPRGDFPLNDDWVYALGVKRLLESGHFQVPAFSNANVGPQIWWGALFAWPFGFSFDALRASTLVLGLVAVLATYALFDELWRDRATALIASVTLLVDPLWLALAQTFMTDVPFLCLLVLSLTWIGMGLRRASRSLVALGLVTGLALTAIRQFGLVVFVGFAAAVLVRGPWTWRRIVVALAPLAVAGAAHLGFSAWLLETGRKPIQEGFAFHTPSGFATASKMIVRETWDAFHLVGLLVLPLGVFCLARTERGRRRRMLWIATVAVAIVILVLLALRGKRLPLGLNIVETFGIGPLTLRDSLALGLNRPEATGRSVLFWRFATVLASFGLATLLVACTVGVRRVVDVVRDAESRRALWPMALVAGVASSYLAMLFVVVVLQYTLFDRYLLPLVLAAALALPVLVGRRSSAPSWRELTPTGVLLAGYALFGIVCVGEYVQWNRLRWQALTQLVQTEHIAPTRIDGGYEFNGWFLYSQRQWDPQGKSPWWVVDDEYVIASGPLDGYVEVRRIPFHYKLTGAEHDLLVLHRKAGGE